MNNILIAEDEAPIANLLRTALEGADYRCVWAADGAAAAAARRGGCSPCRRTLRWIPPATW